MTSQHLRVDAGVGVGSEIGVGHSETCTLGIGTSSVPLAEQIRGVKLPDVKRGGGVFGSFLEGCE